MAGPRPGLVSRSQELTDYADMAEELARIALAASPTDAQDWWFGRRRGGWNDDRIIGRRRGRGTGCGRNRDCGKRGRVMSLSIDGLGVEQPRPGAAQGGGGLALAAIRLDGLEGGQSDGDVALGDGECARRRPFAGI